MLLNASRGSIVVPLTEQVGEVLGVEFGKALTIVDGLAHDEHGGEGEVVVVNNLRKVLELATIDFLIGPRKMIAGGNGRVLRIFLKQFALHIVDWLLANRCNCSFSGIGVRPSPRVRIIV